MPSPFRHNIEFSTIGLLQERSAAWKKGKSQSHWDASVRNPAYVTISCAGVTLPRNEKTFGEVYDNFKPGPLLKNVTLIQGGTYGLTQELSAEIQCHTKSDFEKVETAYAVIGNEVRVKFGYPNKSYAKGGYKIHKSINGYKIVSFEFNTTEDGSWIFKFKAIAAGEGLRDLDLQLTPLPNKFKDKAFKIDGVDHKVDGLLELLDYHAQGNGETALDGVEDGTVRGIAEIGGSLVVYDVTTENNGQTWDRLASFVGMVEKTFGGHDFKVYYTLEYVVNLINKTILEKAKEISNELKSGPDYKIVFDEYSYSYIDQNIVSARPFDILIMGNGAGNYQNNDGRGKDFEGVAANASVEAIVDSVNSSHKIDLKKILIERDIIVGAYNTIKKEKDKSETSDAKSTKDGGLRLENFFNEIFTIINKATGGAIALRLSVPSPTLLNPDNNMQSLAIYDENNGYMPGPLRCIVFDPINGDGTTRSCTVSSDAGSQTYQGAMFQGVQASQDSAAPAQKVSSKSTYESAVNALKTARNTAKENKKSLLKDPGKLAKSGYKEAQQKALEECNTTFHKGFPKKEGMGLLAYPGLRISLTIDGIWGFRMGNAIRTTHLTSKYTNAGAYFHVTEVTHNFDGESSDWSTQIEGQLALHDNLQITRL